MYTFSALIRGSEPTHLMDGTNPNPDDQYRRCVVLVDCRTGLTLTFLVVQVWRFRLMILHKLAELRIIDRRCSLNFINTFTMQGSLGRTLVPILGIVNMPMHAIQRMNNPVSGETRCEHKT